MNSHYIPWDSGKPPIPLLLVEWNNETNLKIHSSVLVKKKSKLMASRLETRYKTKTKRHQKYSIISSLWLIYDRCTNNLLYILAKIYNMYICAICMCVCVFVSCTFCWIQLPHQLIQGVKQFVQPASAQTKVALGGRAADGHFNRCHSALKVVSSVPNTPNTESHQMLLPVPIGSMYGIFT